MKVRRRRRCFTLVAVTLGATAVAFSGLGSGSSKGRSMPQAGRTVVLTGGGADVMHGYFAYRTAKRDAVRDYSSSHMARFSPADFNLRFSPVATGPQYDEAFNSLLLNRLQDLVDERADDHARPHLAYLDGDRAVVEDCVESTSPQNTFPRKPRLVRTVLRLEFGSWKVSLQSHEEITPCRL